MKIKILKDNEGSHLSIENNGKELCLNSSESELRDLHTQLFDMFGWGKKDGKYEVGKSVIERYDECICAKDGSITCELHTQKTSTYGICDYKEDPKCRFSCRNGYKDCTADCKQQKPKIEKLIFMELTNGKNSGFEYALLRKINEVCDRLNEL